MPTISVQVRRLTDQQPTGRAQSGGRPARTVDTMTDRPFGFVPPEGEPGREPQRPGGDQPTGTPPGFDVGALGQMLTQLGQMLSHASTSSGPVNYDLAKELATQRLAAAGGATEPTDAQATAVRDAVRLAEVWL